MKSVAILASIASAATAVRRVDPIYDIGYYVVQNVTDVPDPGYDPAKDPDLLPDAPSFEIESAPFEAEAGGCNGYVRYCNKRLSQVLWIGAHNSLSDVGLAVQRNQFVDGPSLLNAGVRYFDIDTCAYVKNDKRIAPQVCHGDVWWRTMVYQATESGLQRIKSWLDQNPREVIHLNFDDINDFTALNGSGEATATQQLRDEIVATVRSVFGSMAVLRNDPWDKEIHQATAKLQDLIDANRRVVVSVGKGTSSNGAYWGQSDRVCNDEWYPTNLNLASLTDYNWQPVEDYVNTHMRGPCAQAPQQLNKLEWEFHTALGGTIDSSHVGTRLDSYMSALKSANAATNGAPFYPFNLVLTDHSDKWSKFYPQWHDAHLSHLQD
ncbi:hypothetical protein LEN26_007174 [Aphanomyces euteiches]|nr:hypothetical protein LEN26_007174 [Aphanomyces euteiches]